jgi:hypothetical protein
MKASTIDPAEGALGALLDVLASLLLALDITPLRLAQIARASFVKAGALSARKRKSGRPHLARIAALTGLSRAEVKRIVSANFGIGELEPEHSPRSLRVLNAWRNATHRGRNKLPSELKIVGTAPSFQALCKQHSGDIPYRVILDELVQRGCAHLIPTRKSVGISKKRVKRPGRQRDLNSLLFAAALLADLAESDRVLVRRKETVFMPDGISTAYVEGATAGKVDSLLDHLPTTFASKHRSGRKRAAVNVYALVARPKRKNQT